MLVAKLHEVLVEIGEEGRVKEHYLGAAIDHRVDEVALFVTGGARGRAGSVVARDGLADAGAEIDGDGLAVLELERELHGRLGETDSGEVFGGFLEGFGLGLGGLGGEGIGDGPAVGLGGDGLSEEPVFVLVGGVGGLAAVDVEDALFVLQIEGDDVLLGVVDELAVAEVLGLLHQVGLEEGRDDEDTLLAGDVGEVLAADGKLIAEGDLVLARADEDAGGDEGVVEAEFLALGVGVGALGGLEFAEALGDALDLVLVGPALEGGGDPPLVAALLEGDGLAVARGDLETGDVLDVEAEDLTGTPVRALAR